MYFFFYSGRGPRLQMRPVGPKNDISRPVQNKNNVATAAIEENSHLRPGRQFFFFTSPKFLFGRAAAQTICLSQYQFLQFAKIFKYIALPKFFSPQNQGALMKWLRSSPQSQKVRNFSPYFIYARCLCWGHKLQPRK